MTYPPSFIHKADRNRERDRDRYKCRGVFISNIGGGRGGGNWDRGVFESRHGDMKATAITASKHVA